MRLLSTKLVFLLWVVLLPSAFGMDGYYRGVIFNTTAESKLPDRLTLGVTVTSSSSATAVRGTVRFYQGDFGSLEFVALQTEESTYDLITQKLVIRTKLEGTDLLFVLQQVAAGVFRGEIQSDIGKVAEVVLGKFALSK